MKFFIVYLISILLPSTLEPSTIQCTFLSSAHLAFGNDGLCVMSNTVTNHTQAISKIVHPLLHLRCAPTKVPHLAGVGKAM